MYLRHNFRYKLHKYYLLILLQLYTDLSIHTQNSIGLIMEWICSLGLCLGYDIQMCIQYISTDLSQSAES